MNSTTLIKNGRIHRGDRFIDATDLLIVGDRIAAIGRLEGVGADHIIDVSGCVVAPGFIDVQNMTYQLDRLEQNTGVNLLAQGVTSCITGNCGNSGVVSSLLAFRERLDFLERANLGLNIGLLVGHNSLRRFVLQDSDRTATDDECHLMASILEEALENGALGMSSGLMYPPGLFADQQEMSMLASIVGKHNKVYATHMRDEGDDLLNAVDEAITTARGGAARLLIAHLKVTGRKNWGKSAQVIGVIERERSAQDIYVDFYPYSATATVLSIVLLPSILHKTNGTLKNLVYTVEDSELIEIHGKQNLCLKGWDDVVVASSKVPNLTGQSIASLASGVPAYKIVVSILREDPDTRVVFHNIASEDELGIISALPYVMPTTDGYVYPDGSIEATHPRNYGAFPRVMSQYALGRSLFSLEEFIQKSTQLPATVFNLKQRGLLADQHFADIVVFRPEDVQDLATYEMPHVLSKGMEYVFVNGELVFQNNASKGIFPGRLLV